MKLPFFGRDRLSIYLADHHAGATVGVELAKRAAAENQGTEFGEPLARIAGQIEEDLASLEAIMESFDVQADRIKDTVAWTGERLGRLKPNGQLTGYSPLSRMTELDGLNSGVSGKLALWLALKEIAPSEPRLDAEELDRLIGRARRQLTDLRALTKTAAPLAFADR